MRRNSRLPNRVQRSVRICFVVGGIATIASLILAFLDTQAFFQSYLFSFLFWSDLAIGALSLVLIYPMTGGRWGAACRRIMEALADTLPWIALLFIPILLGMKSIYPWLHPEVASDPRVFHKRYYLSAASFLIRAIFYFGSWMVLNFHLQRRSEGIQRSRLPKLCAGGLVFLGFSVTFASVDWQMSVEPTWYSTIYGMVYAVGQALTAFSFTLLVLWAVLSGRRVLPPLATQTFLDLGNILLTLVMVWAYLSFMQYLIVWSGNLPHEVIWFNHRTQGNWRWIAWFLGIFQFGAPFVMLLFRANKDRPHRLAWIAGSLFAVRIIDHYWMLVPGFAPPALHRVNWAALATWIAMGGIWGALFLLRLDSKPVFPSEEELLHG